MPRRARLTLPNVPLHLIQRGNNRQACFFAEEDYRCYQNNGGQTTVLATNPKGTGTINPRP